MNMFKRNFRPTKSSRRGERTSMSNIEISRKRNLLLKQDRIIRITESLITQVPYAYSYEYGHPFGYNDTENLLFTHCPDWVKYSRKGFPILTENYQSGDRHPGLTSSGGGVSSFVGVSRSPQFVRFRICCLISSGTKSFPTRNCHPPPNAL